MTKIWIEWRSGRKSWVARCDREWKIKSFLKPDNETVTKSTIRGGAYQTVREYNLSDGYYQVNQPISGSKDRRYYIHVKNNRIVKSESYMKTSDNWKEMSLKIEELQ